MLLTLICFKDGDVPSVRGTVRGIVTAHHISAGFGALNLQHQTDFHAVLSEGVDSMIKCVCVLKS